MTHVGDVLVTDESTTNPYTYRGPLRSGEERKDALYAFRTGADTTGLAFWHAPASGGARRIAREEVRWS